MLLGGDFRQCLPVVVKGNKTTTLEETIKFPPYLRIFRKLRLTTDMRALHDEDFSNWILDIGNGMVADERVVLEENNVVTSDNLITSIYGEDTRAWTASNMIGKCILTPKNQHTHLINEQITRQLPGEENIYYSHDTVDCDGTESTRNYLTEFLNSVTPAGLPPHKLISKVSMVVMVLRNVAPKCNLYNGSRVVVTKLMSNVIGICFPDNPENELYLPRIDLSPSDSHLPFKLVRRQFPIKPAYAMTINKSQGQTFDKVGLYFPAEVFTHGQLYVALSRVKRRTDFKVAIEKTSQQDVNQDGSAYTRNVVYLEIFAS